MHNYNRMSQRADMEKIMSNDGVTTAFQMILEEVDSVISEVNSQGSAYLRNSDYAKTEDVIAAGKNLASFRSKLEDLKNEWVAGLDEPIRSRVKIETAEVARSIASTSKSARTILVVKFNDGTVIYESKAADTFALTVKKFGLQRVIRLGLRINNFPLVSLQRSDTYSQTAIDNYWVMTHSNTDSKRDQLLKIAAALNEHISVDIVPA